MNETPDSLARLLRDLQQRFLRAEDDRQVRAACDQGGKLLVRASKANLLGFELPSVSATQSPSDDNSTEWASRFEVAIMVFGQQMQETFPGNPSAIHWENRETTGAEQLRVGSTKKQDWRIRAENYAFACGQIADLLGVGTQENAECYVTLLQMGGIVGREKRTMRRLYDNGILPPPAVVGGKGKQHEWRWVDVKPILESEYDKKLPVVFPADKFIRS